MCEVVKLTHFSTNQTGCFVPLGGQRETALGRALLPHSLLLNEPEVSKGGKEREAPFPLYLTPRHFAPLCLPLSGL